jgi:hypothetical protein
VPEAAKTSATGKLAAQYQFDSKSSIVASLATSSTENRLTLGYSKKFVNGLNASVQGFVSDPVGGFGKPTMGVMLNISGNFNLDGFGKTDAASARASGSRASVSRNSNSRSMNSRNPNSRSASSQNLDAQGTVEQSNAPAVLPHPAIAKIQPPVQMEKPSYYKSTANGNFSVSALDYVAAGGTIAPIVPVAPVAPDVPSRKSASPATRSLDTPESFPIPVTAPKNVLDATFQA